MCEYLVEVCHELTCDKFVFGVNDDRLKERHFRTEKLDFGKAVGMHNVLNHQNNKSKK